jgi:hypothetical protein
MSGTVKEIACQALQSGYLPQSQEGRLYELFEKMQADEEDMAAADELINALLDGRCRREWGPPYDWRMAHLSARG